MHLYKAIQECAQTQNYINYQKENKCYDIQKIKPSFKLKLFICTNKNMNLYKDPQSSYNKTLQFTSKDCSNITAI